MSRDPDRPLRRDAVRNRQRLIDAAREVFAERGVNVTLDDVARHAGLGVGTVYRRFPTKEALIEAVFDQLSEQMVKIAERSLEYEDSWAGLTNFLERMNDVVAGDRGVRDVVLGTRRGFETAEKTRASMAPAVNELIARAKADGHLRSDVERTDLFLIDVMVDAVRWYTRGVAPEQWRRCLALILEGLRNRREGPGELPEPALDEEALSKAMRAAGRP